MKNCRNRGDTRTGPSGSVNAARNPTTNEPLTFTTRVPRGKNSPPRSAINPDIQNRAPVPSAPPSITAWRLYINQPNQNSQTILSAPDPLQRGLSASQGS